MIDWERMYHCWEERGLLVYDSSGDIAAHSRGWLRSVRWLSGVAFLLRERVKSLPEKLLVMLAAKLQVGPHKREQREPFRKLTRTCIEEIE